MGDSLWTETSSLSSVSPGPGWAQRGCCRGQRVGESCLCPLVPLCPLEDEAVICHLAPAEIGQCGAPPKSRLSLGSPEADPETRIGVPIVYLGGAGREHGGIAMRQGREECSQGCVNESPLWAAGIPSPQRSSRLLWTTHTWRVRGSLLGHLPLGTAVCPAHCPAKSPCQKTPCKRSLGWAAGTRASAADAKPARKAPPALM